MEAASIIGALNKKENGERGHNSALSHSASQPLIILKHLHRVGVQDDRASSGSRALSDVVELGRLVVY